MGIPQRVYDEITGEAEGERAKKIIDEAELRARGIQNPREPDWESFKVCILQACLEKVLATTDSSNTIINTRASKMASLY